MNDEIVINGETYVKKKDFESEPYFIVRTYSAGVFAGNIESRTGQEVVMTNARRLWSWSGASSLSELSVKGTSKPKDCKFPCIVPRVELLQVIEILPVSPEAKKSIESVKEWSAQ